MALNNQLPIDAYTSFEFFLLEQKHIFSTTWAFAGFIEDLTNEGDYLSIQVGLNNILIIKNDGKLVAFHNMCRHRGTRLLEGKGNTDKKLTCPYHDWSYDLKGNLLSLPKAKAEFPTLDKTCNSLIKANVGIWRGMIWVHPNKDSESIEDWFGEINDYLGPHQIEQLIEPENSIVIEEINANWKVVVENYIDHYHLAQLHAGTLNMYDHKKAEFGFVGHHFRFWQPLSKSYFDDIKKNSPYPLLYDVSQGNLGTWVPMLFPGIGLTESESSWSVFHIKPISVDKTQVVIRTKMKNCSSVEYMKQSYRSASFWQKNVKPKNSKYAQDHPLGSADFMKEDIFICEQVQKSFNSPFFEFGPLAQKGELPVKQHRELIWQYINPYWKHN